MAYRKITVDGKEYEYVVGKWQTKVKGIGLFKHHDWAYVIDVHNGHFRVSPKHVEGMIRGTVFQDHDPYQPPADYYNEDAYYDFLGNSKG